MEKSHPPCFWAQKHAMALTRLQQVRTPGRGFDDNVKIVTASRAFGLDGPISLANDREVA